MYRSSYAMNYIFLFCRVLSKIYHHFVGWEWGWGRALYVLHTCFTCTLTSLWWRHNDHDSVSNHQPHECLLNRLFRRRSKKTSRLRVTGLCVGNSPGPVNSPHKGPVTRKMFPFDDVIMIVWLSQCHWCNFVKNIFVELHYSGVIMSAMASQITGFSVVCSTVCSGADQRKRQSSASLTFVWGVHQIPLTNGQ